jgi:hypothetical protein
MDANIPDPLDRIVKNGLQNVEGLRLTMDALSEIALLTESCPLAAEIAFTALRRTRDVFRDEADTDTLLELVPDRLARDVQSFVGDPLDAATGQGRR